jgi:hypothetical protein
MGCPVGRVESSHTLRLSNSEHNEHGDGSNRRVRDVGPERGNGVDSAIWVWGGFDVGAGLLSRASGKELSVGRESSSPFP